MKSTKYDAALRQNPGNIIVVFCDDCDVAHDVRFVKDEIQHPYATHVMSFTCPQGHRSEARRVWATEPK
jgi:hypothetical protein